MRQQLSPVSMVTVVTLLVLTGARQAPADPILQEVLYDADGPDAGGVFTEIFGEPGLSLDGWSLVGINGGTGLPYRTIDLTGAIIPADGLLVIAQDSAEADLAAVRDFAANVDWQNGPDAVHLLDPLAVVVDALQYGDAGPNNSGLGLPAPDAPGGSSLSRDVLGTDTRNNLDDFLVGDPTPGFGPVPMPPTPLPQPTPVPEPTTLLLLGAGLLPLAIRGRRR